MKTIVVSSEPCEKKPTNWGIWRNYDKKESHIVPEPQAVEHWLSPSCFCDPERDPEGPFGIEEWELWSHKDLGQTES